MKETLHEFVDLHHFMPTRFDRIGGFWLIRAGRNVAKPNYWVGRKQIDCFGLHVLRSGSLLLRFGDQQVHLHAGDLFCLFPHLSYEYQIAGEDELQMLWLSLQGPQLPELLQAIGVTPAEPYRRQAIREKSLDTLQEMERLVWEQPAARKLTMFSALCRFFESLELDSPLPHQQDQPATDNWIQEAERFFQLHYTEELRIHGVADAFGLHRSYFSHAFTQKVGISPQQYIQRLRLQRAQQLLLQDPDLTVGEIALSVGYPDLYTFSRAFKRHVGCSPSDYRLST
ncbi:AraC family transcriptional regulator [Paenibacillus ferrarius]|uniref:helix-turn-helix transcriptional regulator n=1 Tax=Paenibacillus ferrarius TaxID=1469647 RepID=UPI003D2AE206